MARSTVCERSSARACRFSSLIVLRAAWSRSSLSFFACAISSAFAAATSCWFRRISSAASARAFSSVAFISADAASAAARSLFADSMASAMALSRGRLAGGALHGGRGQTADAKAGAEHRESGADARSEVAKRELVHVRLSTSKDASGPGGGERHVVAGCGPEAARSPARVFAERRKSVCVLRHPDEQRGQHGEHVSLHESHEQLEHEDAERERHRHRRNVDGEEQGQRDEEEDDDVSRHHVGEETDGEGERLGEESEELDHEHQRPEGPGDAGGNEVRPVADRALRAHAGDLREHEREEREDDSDRDVSRRRGDAGKAAERRDWQEATEVHEEDEEERRAEIGRVEIRVVADVLHRDLVPDEHHERLQQVVPAAGDHGAPAGAEADDDQQDAGGDPHVDHVLGDVEADVAVAGPEPERDHDLVLDVLEDVLRDATLVLFTALLVLALALCPGSYFLMAQRRAVLARRRAVGVAHRNTLPLMAGLRLRKQKGREKDDHGVAPCGLELACTNSTSITWVAAYSVKKAAANTSAGLPRAPDAISPAATGAARP